MYLFPYHKQALSALLTILLSLYVSLSLFAQPVNADLMGQLLDNAKSPVAYATVALMRDDTMLVSGALSMETGDFAFAGLAPGRYVMKVDHLEYASWRTESFTLMSGDQRVLPAIGLLPSTNNLTEVVVKVEPKPPVEVRVDKIVFNVAGRCPARLDVYPRQRIGS